MSDEREGTRCAYRQWCCCYRKTWGREGRQVGDETVDPADQDMETKYTMLYTPKDCPATIRLPSDDLVVARCGRP